MRINAMISTRSQYNITFPSHIPYFSDLSKSPTPRISTSAPRETTYFVDMVRDAADRPAFFRDVVTFSFFIFQRKGSFAEREFSVYREGVVRMRGTL
jgi:hypothetical protein